LTLGNATDNPPLSVLGTGQITLTGNVDALAGLDITGNATMSGFWLNQSLVLGGGYALTQTVPGTDDWGKTATGSLTLPASLGPSVAIYPVTGLQTDDVIRAFACVGAINSGGNAVNVTFDLRKLTKAAAATMTDASVSAFGLPAKTAAYAIEDGPVGLAETVTGADIYYFRITGTTTGGTSIDLGGCRIVRDAK
jgi:hypothetical protein